MIPTDYVCKKCGATGVKLWREYQTFANHTKLLCGACTSQDQGRPLDLSDGDQCGWMVPAVPTLEPEAPWWGYTSVPAEGVAWWKALPLQLDGEWKTREGTMRWLPQGEWLALRPFVPCVNTRDGKVLVLMLHKTA
jgi:hypothetical protein